MKGRPRSLGRRRWVIGPAVALVMLVAGWRWTQAPKMPRNDDLPSSEVPASPPAAALPGTVATALRDAHRQAVDGTVAQRNRAAAEQADAVRAAGWTMVNVAPPDPRLVALDPTLLTGREGELRAQITSTDPPPELADRLGAIARAAHEPATRVAAVEALGRIRTPEAQDELLALLPQLPPDDPARRAIVPLLRPESLGDPLAARLATLIDGATVTPVERQQAAFTLALLGLRDGNTLPRGGASPAAGRLIEQMTALAQRGSGDRKGGSP